MKNNASKNCSICGWNIKKGAKSTNLIFVKLKRSKIEFQEVALKNYLKCFFMDLLLIEFQEVALKNYLKCFFMDLLFISLNKKL